MRSLLPRTKSRRGFRNCLELVGDSPGALLLSHHDADLSSRGIFRAHVGLGLMLGSDRGPNLQRTSHSLGREGSRTRPNVL